MQTFIKIAFLVVAQLTFSHYISVSLAQELSKNNPNGLDSYTEEEFKKLPKVNLLHTKSNLELDTSIF